MRVRARPAAVPTATTARTPAPIVPMDQNRSPDQIDLDWLSRKGAKPTTVTTNAVTPPSIRRGVLLMTGTTSR
ncbi:hypothetical protein CJ178_12265 [Rhodococcus sp. ACPA4]|nr:hypothetical protein [Rhodococcus sp. MS16]PBC42268.1 hypothetical protein CJ178_12265 [Rhodococcus sp. ACPA4]PSR41754.1 hypothetical protein C7T36_05665 [Rhodococcus sp. AD45-ID]ROZ49556.1 hypothetical protein EEB13_06495 [Rhodococcus sp. WS3]RZL21551.1 MAG: hypothetical protein EOP31_27490 [Rhodococcus sp. (in: high G+C Gram-positive bacteria)]